MSALSLDVTSNTSLGARLSTYLHLGIGPSWHLNNHVEDSLLLVGVQRNVVERRARLAILLDVDAVLESVGGVDLAGSVDGGRLAGVALLGDREGGHVCCNEGVVLAMGCRHWSDVALQLKHLANDASVAWVHSLTTYLWMM